MSSATSHSTNKSVAGLAPVRFTVQQFDQLLDSGALDGFHDQRIELFRGEVMYMTPPNPPHDYVVELLGTWACDQTVHRRSELSVRVQSSMDLTDDVSVPSPDLLIVRTQSYRQRRPGPKETLLLVEVSDSSVHYDLREKMELYAAAGIQEYWVIDIPHRCLVRHLAPSNGRFNSLQTFDEHTPVTCSLIPELTLTLGSLLE